MALLLTAVVVDQFGMAQQPATALNLVDLLLILGGIGLMQAAAKPPPT